MENEFNGVVSILFRMEKILFFAFVHNQKTGNITFPAWTRENKRENNELSSEKTFAMDLLEETELRKNECKARKLPIIHNLPAARGRKRGQALKHCSIFT